MSDLKRMKDYMTNRRDELLEKDLFDEANELEIVLLDFADAFDADSEVQRLREALQSIADGNWSCELDRHGLEVWRTNRINPHHIAMEALSPQKGETPDGKTL